MNVFIDRAEVKKASMKALDGKFWILLLCNLCYMAIAFGAGVIVSLISTYPVSVLKEMLTALDIYDETLCTTVLWIISVVIGRAITFPYYVCLTTVPLAIVNNEKITVSKIFAPISKLRYFIEYAITGVEIFVCTFLWSFLFIFPGHMAFYRYRFANYILATTEEMTAGEAIAKSKELTYGNKFQLFVLDLSFIGWILFGVITCGLGLLFANCYYQVVSAMYYKKIAEAHEVQEMQEKQQETKKEPEAKETKQEKAESSVTQKAEQEATDSPESQNNQEPESPAAQADQEIKEESVSTENQEKSEAEA